MDIASSFEMSRPLPEQTSRSPLITWSDLFKSPRFLLHLDYQRLIALSQVNRHLHETVDPQIASEEDKFTFVINAEKYFPQHFPDEDDERPWNFACYYCFRVRGHERFNFQSIRKSTWRRVCTECSGIANNQRGMSMSSYPVGMCLFPVCLPTSVSLSRSFAFSDASLLVCEAPLVWLDLVSLNITDAGNASQHTWENIYQSMFPIAPQPVQLAITPPVEVQGLQTWGVLPRTQGHLSEQEYVTLPDFVKES